jgi:hypothetical protein
MYIKGGSKSEVVDIWLMKYRFSATKGEEGS